MKAAAEKEEDQGVNGHSLLLIDHEREHACFDGLLVVWQTLQCVSKPPSSISDPLTGLT